MMTSNEITAQNLSKVSNGTKNNFELNMTANNKNSYDEQQHTSVKENVENFNIIAKTIIFCRKTGYNWASRNKHHITHILVGTLFVLYWIYFAFAIKLAWDNSESYCEGVRFLFVITVLVTAGLVYHQVVKRFFGKTLSRHFVKPLSKAFTTIWNYTAVRWIVMAILLGSVIVFLVLDSTKNRKRLVSAGGVVVFILLGYIFSKHPGHVVWRKTIWGLGLQFCFALIILRWDVGRGIFQCLGNKVATFLAYTDNGSSFIYGYLVTGQLAGWDNSTTNGTLPALPKQAQLFAFKVLPVLFFFSLFISIMYFYGIMPWILRKLGWLLQVTVGTTACESINSAAAMFVGMTEAPLVIKPYLPLLTKSELHAVMAGGFANIAGSTLAAYISFGINPSYLISASLMSAPAALGFAKLLYPETEESKTKADAIQLEKGTEKNVLEAAANGATIAVPLVLNIGACLVAFISFIYFMDGILVYFGSLLGWDFFTFDWLFSRIFIPIAYIMGVDWNECDKVAKLIGIKTIFNEYIAYSELQQMMLRNEISYRGQTIATYALCGFANLSSVGIQLGCLGAMVPERKTDLAQVAFRALIAGATTNFMTACIAGSLMD